MPGLNIVCIVIALLAVWNGFGVQGPPQPFRTQISVLFEDGEVETGPSPQVRLYICTFRADLLV